MFHFADSDEEYSWNQMAKKRKAPPLEEEEEEETCPTIVSELQGSALFRFERHPTDPLLARLIWDFSIVLDPTWTGDITKLKLSLDINDTNGETEPFRSHVELRLYNIIDQTDWLPVEYSTRYRVKPQFRMYCDGQQIGWFLAGYDRILLIGDEPTVDPVFPQITLGGLISNPSYYINGTIQHFVRFITSGTNIDRIIEWEWMPPLGAPGPNDEWKEDTFPLTVGEFERQATITSPGVYWLRVVGINDTTGETDQDTASFEFIDYAPTILGIPIVVTWEVATPGEAWFRQSAKGDDPEQGNNVTNFFYWKNQTNNPYTITGDDRWNFGDPAQGFTKTLPGVLNFFPGKLFQGENPGGVHVLVLKVVDVGGNEIETEIPINFDNAINS